MKMSTVRKKKHKHRHAPSALVKLPPPPKMRETKFVRVLEGWKCVSLAYEQNGTYYVPHVVSPAGKVYRYAQSWEKPSLVIDADILPAEHHIRLVRVIDKATRRLAKKALRRLEKR